MEDLLSTVLPCVICKYCTISCWKKSELNLRYNFLTICSFQYFHLITGVAAPFLRSEASDGVLRGHCDLRSHSHLHVRAWRHKKYFCCRFSCSSETWLHLDWAWSHDGLVTVVVEKQGDARAFKENLLRNYLEIPWSHGRKSLYQQEETFHLLCRW